MRKFKILDWIAFVLLVIGGLNWGMVGLFDIDLVAKLFGEMTVVSKVIYDVVGLSALYMLVIALSGKEKAEQ
jgi:hypothetical protein